MRQGRISVTIDHESPDGTRELAKQAGWYEDPPDNPGEFPHAKLAEKINDAVKAAGTPCHSLALAHVVADAAHQERVCSPERLAAIADGPDRERDLLWTQCLVCEAEMVQAARSLLAARAAHAAWINKRVEEVTG